MVDHRLRLCIADGLGDRRRTGSPEILFHGSHHNRGMDQVIQIAGALLILAGFVLAQLRVWSTEAWGYLWVNLVGAGILAWVALVDSQWGFFLLEGVWTLVTAWSMVRKLRRSGASSSPA
jgi:hypothetical protein